MTPNLVYLKDLFGLQFRELFDSYAWEIRIIELADENANHPQLKKIILHIQNSLQNNKINLEEINRQIKLRPLDNSDEPGKAIWQKTQKLVSHCKDAPIRDVVIINSIQRLFHDKIFMLAALASYAIEMEALLWASLLHKQSAEVKSFEKKLSELAEREINKKSLAAKI